MQNQTTDRRAEKTPADPALIGARILPSLTAAMGVDYVAIKGVLHYVANHEFKRGIAATYYGDATPDTLTLLVRPCIGDGTGALRTVDVAKTPVFLTKQQQWR